MAKDHIHIYKSMKAALLYNTQNSMFSQKQNTEFFHQTTKIGVWCHFSSIFYALINAYVYTWKVNDFNDADYTKNGKKILSLNLPLDNIPIL